MESVATFSSVDPGGPCLGWAKWRDGRLEACGISRTKTTEWTDRAREHRSKLEELGCYPGTVLTECMRYRGRAGAGSPQILIELNAIAGHVGTHWVEPAEWKGCVPKDDHQPLILAALEPDELELVEDVFPHSLRHNAIDAVGIGLFYLRRLVPAPTAPKPKRKRKNAANHRPRGNGKRRQVRGVRAPSAR